MSREKLECLIDLARKYRAANPMTPEEQKKQVRSFAFGNTHLENESITMEDIDKAMESLKLEREQESICP
jgi:hypothetical protein